MAFRFAGIECDTIEELEALQRKFGAVPATADHIDWTGVGKLPDYFQTRPMEPMQPCAHMSCSLCHGTGVRTDGLGMCVHMLYCSCPRCSVHCLSVSTTLTYTI